jgi:hypothetical protein
MGTLGNTKKERSKEIAARGRGSDASATVTSSSNRQVADATGHAHAQFDLGGDRRQRLAHIDLLGLGQRQPRIVADRRLAEPGLFGEDVIAEFARVQVRQGVFARDERDVSWRAPRGC